MLKGHKIVTDFNVYWHAYLDSYDGAPDTKGADSMLGHGLTEIEAIADLLERLDALQ